MTAYWFEFGLSILIVIFLHNVLGVLFAICNERNIKENEAEKYLVRVALVRENLLKGAFEGLACDIGVCDESVDPNCRNEDAGKEEEEEKKQ